MIKNKLNFKFFVFFLFCEFFRFPYHRKCIVNVSDKGDSNLLATVCGALGR